jgi:Fic family protein
MHNLVNSFAEKMSTYIFQQDAWPKMNWQCAKVLTLLGKVRYEQGKLLGKMGSLDPKLQSEAGLKSFIKDIIAACELEGEIYSPEQIQASINRLMDSSSTYAEYTERHMDGLVYMMMDATEHSKQPLTIQRLHKWHHSIFPMGRSGLINIIVGDWRIDSLGVIHVASTTTYKEKIRLNAPKGSDITKEINQFIEWFNEDQDLDPILKAGVAHFWLMTIKPYEDGNARIACAISDVLLARADEVLRKYYSLSQVLVEKREEYYQILERVQIGKTDITEWLMWYLGAISEALKKSEDGLGDIMFKQTFWLKNAKTPLNKRQVGMINTLLQEKEKNVNSSLWGKYTKCSTDTALRDIQDLMKKRILKKRHLGGRSTSYELLNEDFIRPQVFA